MALLVHLHVNSATLLPPSDFHQFFLIFLSDFRSEKGNFQFARKTENEDLLPIRQSRDRTFRERVFHTHTSKALLFEGKFIQRKIHRLSLVFVSNSAHFSSLSACFDHATRLFSRWKACGLLEKCSQRSTPINFVSD